MEIKTEKQALLESYLMMIKTDAWKELRKYAEDERDSSMKRIDSKSAADLTLGDVCEERGIRKGIHKILRHVDEMSETI